MAEAGGAEVNVDLRWQHQVSPRRLVGQEGHHQVLQQAERRAKLHVDAARHVRRLLQECCRCRQFEDIDWDALNNYQIVKPPPQIHILLNSKRKKIFKGEKPDRFMAATTERGK